ncbi:hypothetical protein B0T19DRAFT_405567 [Cercophora scortea]|uniref:CFEM domain-containing protein n=1 Tax=Cercophora scortea TaxID=314031 RepID=A0AAE0I201_9PEZI|nr:hypothetical protein B0T19DRAFT_405567 [Cercophora scortea]
MKCTIILALASLAMGSAIEQRACAGNNCNRQVTGTRAGLPALATRAADCASFLAVTVKGVQRTITQTHFVAEATPTVAVVAARQATSSSVAKAIPTYASSCDERAYSSACGCAGVVPTTTTVRVPRATSTVTAVATGCVAMAVSEIPACGLPCFEEKLADYGCKNIFDIECQCSQIETFGWEITACLEINCSHAVVEEIYPNAVKGCNCHAVEFPGSLPAEFPTY